MPRLIPRPTSPPSPGAQPGREGDPILLLGIAGGAYALILVMWSLGNLLVGRFGRIPDAAFLPVFLDAAIVTFAAGRARALARRERIGWCLFATAHLMLWQSTVLWFLREAVPGFTTPAWLGHISIVWYPLMLVGLSLFPSAPRAAAERTKFWLDSTTVLIAAAVLIWFFLFRGTAPPEHRTAQTFLYWVLYPVGDLVTLFVLGAVVLRGSHGGGSQPLHLLGLATALSVGYDLIYGQGWLKGLYPYSSATDLLWVGSGLCATLAGAWQYRTARGTAARSRELSGRRSFSVLPYFAVGCVYAALVLSIRDQWHTAVGGLLLAVGLMTAIVIARQIAALRENDVLVRQRLEQDVRFRSLVQNAADLIAVIGANDSISFASPSVCRLAGRTADALEGSAIASVVHPDDAELVAEHLAAARASSSPAGPVTWRLLQDSGEFRRVESVAMNLLDDSAVRGVVINARDVTEQSALEAQLLQAQKLEAVGLLAGGIAHDFNNLLAAIKCNAELLRDARPPAAAHDDELDEIHRAVSRGMGLTRQLLAFSRKQVLQAQRLDANRILAEMEPMLRRLVAKGIVLEVRRADVPIELEIDRGQLEQIILNLALNARDAIADAGSLRVEFDYATFDDVSPPPAGLARGSHAILRVSDTGCGMTDEVKERLFEPFFTTKRVGEGTGLGLSTVYAIVTQRGGRIAIDSAVGVGTTVTVYLPSVQHGAAVPSHTGEFRTPVQPGAGTVLVVDDEESIRRAVARYLERTGYSVLTAASGVEALEVFTTSARRIDLLVTDMVMPEMDGRQLIERAVALDGALKVVCMSGYTEDSALRDGSRRDVDFFIQKPFSLDRLAHVVRETLAANR